MKGLQPLQPGQRHGPRAVRVVIGAQRHRPASEGVVRKVAELLHGQHEPDVVSWSFNDVPTGNPGGTDGAVFACKGTPSFGLGAVGWNYGTYTWHTNRDTYDKIAFDDLKHNATLAAMLAYEASEDPSSSRATARRVPGRPTGRRTAARRREKRSRGSRPGHDTAVSCSKLLLKLMLEAGLASASGMSEAPRDLDSATRARP